jgi:uncharacterized Zn finger protein
MITLEARVENAWKRADQERVRPIRLRRDQYLVASSSRPGHGYLVYVDEGQVVCSCPAAEWSLPCKHVAAVTALEQMALAA